MPAKHNLAVGHRHSDILLALWGTDWVRQPTLTPAMIIGIGRVAAPFLLMQPGMGLDVAASRTPTPSAARLRSLTTHTVFGVGLYAAGWAASLLARALNRYSAIRCAMSTMVLR